jgi:tartronate-semialdehyde synthase
MSRMIGADAAVKILELEGASQTFGLPPAAINPFYAAVRGEDAPTTIVLLD